MQKLQNLKNILVSLRKINVLAASKASYILCSDHEVSAFLIKVCLFSKTHAHFSSIYFASCTNKDLKLEKENGIEQQANVKDFT